MSECAEDSLLDENDAGDDDDDARDGDDDDARDDDDDASSSRAIPLQSFRRTDRYLLLMSSSHRESSRAF